MEVRDISTSIVTFLYVKITNMVTSCNIDVILKTTGY